MTRTKILALAASVVAIGIAVFICCHHCVISKADLTQAVDAYAFKDSEGLYGARDVKLDDIKKTDDDGVYVAIVTFTRDARRSKAEQDAYLDLLMTSGGKTWANLLKTKLEPITAAHPSFERGDAIGEVEQGIILKQTNELWQAMANK